MPFFPVNLGVLLIPPLHPTSIPSGARGSFALVAFSPEGHKQRSVTGSLGTISGLQMCSSACIAFLSILEIEKFQTNI